MPENIELDVDDQSAPGSIVLRTAETLRRFADELEGGKAFEPVEWTIPMGDIGTERMELHCDEIAGRLGKKHLGVYALCFDDNVPLDRIYQFVDENKARNKALPVQERRAFARVNKRRGCLGSRCLYVGKSEKVAERIRQHLTEAHPATYAVHLQHWPQDIPGNLVVKIIGVSGVQSVMLPFIEDQIVREMPPILGKRGSV